MVDYRRLRLSNLTSPEFNHLLPALYWPVHGVLFAAVEQLRPLAACHPVWCPLDNLIPFNEWFLIPYLIWFLYIPGMLIYLALYDTAAFRRFMYFIIATYGVTLLVYLIYPTCQNLRPTVFPRDNFLTRLTIAFYEFDTNTNVCPSLHCIGSFAVAFAAWDTPRFRNLFWKVSFFAMSALISVSTVFVKQHSVVDVFWALVVCAAGYALVYGRKKPAAQPV